MALSFALENHILGCSHAVELTADEFTALEKAMSQTLLRSALEEKFDIVLENFIELESSVIDANLRHMIRRHFEYDQVHAVRVLITRRLINLLTATKLYFDHVKNGAKAIERLAGLPSGTVRQKMATAEAEHFSVRFLIALRNVAQHSELPVSGISFNSSWKNSDGADWRPRNNEDASHSVYQISFSVSSNLFQNDRKISPSLRDEIVAQGEKIALLPIVREYLEILAGFHEWVRAESALITEQSSLLIRQSLQEFAEGAGKKPANLQAVKKDESERGYRAKISIFEEPIAYADALSKMNTGFQKLSRRVVTSRAD